METEEVINRIDNWCQRFRIFDIAFPYHIENNKPGDSSYEFLSVSLTKDKLVKTDLQYAHCKELFDRGLITDIGGLTLTFFDVINITEKNEDTIYNDQNMIVKSAILLWKGCQKLTIDNLNAKVPVVRGAIYFEKADITFGRTSILRL